MPLVSFIGRVVSRYAPIQLSSIGFAIIGITLMLQPALAQNSNHLVYLPVVNADQAQQPRETPEPTAQPTAAPTAQPTATTAPPAASTLNTQELQIEELFRSHPEQQRVTMILNPILSQEARKKAEDMGKRTYFAHVNPDGHGPNFLVKQAGYQIPAFYDQSPAGNNIESIAAGYDSAEAMWNYWLTSPGHRTHLLGEQSFYQEQIEYGIGYAYVPGSPYLHYWVIFSSKPGQ